jgi:hypothetical protein
MSQVVITERDLAMLRWVGEQTAVPMRVLALVAPHVWGKPLTASSADTVARRHARRLEVLGYAERKAMLGQTWLIPTRPGLRSAGLEYRAWQPSEFILRHLETVARLRLQLESQYAADLEEWESERSIRSRWAHTGVSVRIADAGLHWNDGTATGVECELHIKRQPRYDAAIQSTDKAWTGGVWWFTKPGRVGGLQRLLDAAGGGEVHQAYPLPEGTAP